MKFTCDRCGKRYASLDEPVPGRIYRVRCGRCGSLVTVTAPAAGDETPGAAFQLAPPRGADEPDLDLDVAVVGDDAAESRAALQAGQAGAPVAAGGDGGEELAIDLALSDEYPLVRRRRLRHAVVGLSATAGLALAALLWVVLRTGGGAPGPARAEPEGAPARRAEEARPGAGAGEPAGAAPAVRLEAAGGQGTAAPPATGTRLRRRRSAPPPAVAFEPRANEPRAPRPVPVDAGLAETLRRKEDATVAAGLPPDLAELQAALEARRGELDRCAAAARGTSGAAPWEGRRPQLVVKVLPSGEAEARVDDPALEPTELAACLRRAAARTAFPSFAGEPVELRTPAPAP